MMYGNPVSLTEHCQTLIKAFGSVRAASDKLGIDYAYLHRLSNGQKTEPSDEVLKKLGLKAIRQTSYFKIGGNKK